MEQENRAFIHDTINLDEIRMLLGEDILPIEETDVPEEVPAQLENDSAAVIDEIPDKSVDAIEAEGSSLLEDEEDDFEIPSFLMDESDNNEQEAVSKTETEEDSSSEMTDEETIANDQPDVVSEQVTDDTDEEKPEKKKNSAAFELYSMLHDVIYLLAAVTLIFVFIVRLVGVKGDSMLPTLHNRDYLILESNFLYGGDELSYGDVVVLNVPSPEMKDEGPIVKRVIATEGQEVNIDFETGAVFVDGVLLHETYINSPTNYNWDGDYGLEYPAIVPENCIFVLGDNRNNSLDSRYAPIGMVDERCVLGKVLVIALPGQTVDGAGNVIDPRDWGRIGLVS